jgi:DNA-directed RNA polymerase subunit L
MSIKILELGKDKVRLVVAGEGHTFLNALTAELLKNPDVDIAKYHMEFQFSDPELTVTTNNGADPVEAIKEACRTISGYCDTILSDIEKK